MFSSIHPTSEKLAFSNQSSNLKKIMEKLRFRNGLVWTEDLTVKRKLHFNFLQLEERFRDRLVWMVDLTLEIKLCFQLPPIGRAFS